MRNTEDLRQPYPGLRPFEADEADLFFGREEQVDALLTRLAASHFVAVVGESGAGKSSLVRAGLLPALEAGFVVEAGSDWRVAVLRPGGAPLTALADAVLAPGVLSANGGTPRREFALAELRRGPLGLAQLVRDARLGPSCNTLVVVDQFEELFRSCREPAQKDQASIFVELLLHASRQRQAPIFVVLTMRSDYVGNCARFCGLPEMLNDNQYLTPRLTRDQVAAAIREPARVCGGIVEDDLVDALCNAVGDDQDQLPLLQHLLMRLWDEASHQTAPPPALGGRQPRWPRLTTELSTLVGGLRSALSNHAQQIYEWLAPDERAVARMLFKCLTDAQGQRRDVRRDALVSEVAAVAGVSVESTIAVADQFRAAGRHMLMPPPVIPLNGGSRLDISHESLLRQWSTLQQWASEEGTNLREFARLCEEARRERNDQGELLSGRDLGRAQDWLKQAEPTAAWAERYGSPGDLEATLSFIRKSEDQAARRRDEELLAARREADAGRARRRNYMLGSAVVIVSALAIGTSTLWQRAERNRGEAERERFVAEEQRAKATMMSNAATEQANRADDNARKATGLAHDMEQQKALVEQQKALVEQKKRVVEEQNDKLARARSEAQARLLTNSSTQALQRDAALAALLARAALSEHPGDARALQSLREAIAAHVPNVRPDFEAARFRNYIPGSNKGLWLDFSLKAPSLSPIDDLAVTPSGENAVVWSTASGEHIRTLRGHTGLVGSAIFSPDGRWVVTAGADKTVRIWDVATGRQLQQLEHAAMVNGAVFNRAGTLLVTLADDTNAKLWAVDDFSRPRCDIRLPADPQIRVDRNFVLASFSQDQNLLATVTTSPNKTFRAEVWNVAAPQCPRVETPGLDGLDIRWGGFSDRGPWFAAVNMEGEVALLDVAHWTVQRRFKPDVPFHTDFDWMPQPVGWSTDGEYFAYAGGDNALYIAAIAKENRPIPLRGHAGRVTSISFAPGDAALLTTSNDKTARVWVLAPNKSVIERLILRGHTEAVGSGVFSPRGEKIVTAGDDLTVRSWTLLPVLREWKGANVASAAYSADGSHIWAAGGLDPVRKEGRLTYDGFWVSKLSEARLSARRDTLEVHTTQPTFYGSRIVDADRTGRLNVRDVRTPAEVHPLADGTSSLAGGYRLPDQGFSGTSPDGRFAFSRILRQDDEKDKKDKKDEKQEKDEPGSTLVWNLSTPLSRPDLVPQPSGRPCQTLGISNDRQLAWYCAEDDLVLISPEGQAGPTIIHMEREKRVESARFSARGRLLALALDDYSVRVFDTSSGRPQPSMTGHSGRIRSLDFSSDNRFLASAADDRTARVWDVSTGWLAAVINVADRTRLTGATFSPDGLSLLLLAPDRLLVWRCYACGDSSVLLEEVRRRNIERKLSPAEETEYGITSQDLAPGALNRQPAQQSRSGSR